MSRLSADIDLLADGKETGFVRVPHSVHRSAYGWIPIPIVRIKSGEGPSVLMQAGNHGDEWEGQIGLGKPFCARSSPETYQGPAGDPAVGQFSRRHGRPTDIADRRRQPQPLLPRRRRRHHYPADRLLDRARPAAGALTTASTSISGGSSLTYIPSARWRRATATRARMAKVIGMLKSVRRAR